MTNAPSAKFVKWSIYLLSVIQITSAISSYMQYSLLEKFQFGSMSVSEFEILATSNDQREQLIGLIFIIIFVLSLIVSARWIYKAAEYNSNLGAADLQYTPGWTVGWFFVPILSLCKPYQAFKQLHQVAVNWRDWQSVSVPSIFPIWWGLWILSNLIGQVLFRTADKLDSIASMQAHSLAYVFTLPIELALNYAFLKVVLDIAKNQEASS